jgi:O-antigen/teichoic acid export membrane protein
LKGFKNKICYFACEISTMPQTSSLFKNTLIYTIGNFGSRVLAFILLPIYSFYLNPEELGYYDLILTSLMLLTPLITIQVSESVYRWLLDYPNDEEKKNTIVSNGVFILLLSLISSFILFVTLKFFTEIQFLNYIFIIFICYSIFVFLQQTIIGLGLNKIYAGVSILNSFLLFCLSVVFIIFLDFKLKGLLYAMIFSNLISILFIVFKINILKYLQQPTINLNLIREFLVYSWPLIPNTISWWLINEVNRFIILWNLDIESNGIFAVAIRFPSILLIINSIFMLAWQDQTIQNYNSKDKNEYNGKIFNSFMKFQICVAIILISSSRFVVHNFFGQAYFESWKFMTLLYIGVVFSSFAAFLGAEYLGAKKTREIFTTTIFGSVINIIISFAFINQIGLFAPAFGTFIGFLIIWLVRLIKAGKYEIINWKVFMILSFTMFLYFILTQIENDGVDLIMFIISILLFIYFNHHLIKYLLNKLTSIFLSKN